MANDLFARLSKASSIKETSPLMKSRMFTEKDTIPIPVPMLNVACSGKLDGGLKSGLTTIAGNTQTFKTLFALVLASAYMEEHKDAVLLFYDNEFGTPPDYMKSVGIDLERVVHIPFTNIEELKFDLVKKLKSLEKNDHAFFLIDSIGNAASIKELTDAENEKSVNDMTRAKQLKSLFRMVTPFTATKNVPIVAINHVYMTQELYSKPVVSGGTGMHYSSDSIWIITKRKVKEGKELAGHDFIINIVKSRFVKENSKIPITVTYGKGINKYSGLWDIAIETGYVISEKQGWYKPVISFDKKTGEMQYEETQKRRADLDIPEFWKKALEKGSPFVDMVNDKFSIPTNIKIFEEIEHEELNDE